ncbi:hypothetical protein [Streptomyces sp. A1136]|uniref:hypothetical protein n=1 Tax=Streptomyces sp. A1136 TaxID=2563102 RepID=UPI00109E604F|nr:hypothetical protein [Streptomyces sp. A1136]THA50160.1 hypothetical protein E6R62_25995 [Streptomyces sp. A1136]
MGGTQDKRPWSGKGPDEARRESEIPAGQDPVHPGQPAHPSHGEASKALRRHEEEIVGEDDHAGGYDEL